MPLPQKEQTNVRDYIRTIFRRKKLFLIPAVSLLIIALVASFIVPKTYEASTLVLVGEELLIKPLVKDLAIPTSVKDRLDTLREEILSWTRLVELIRKLNLDKEVNTQLEFENLLIGIRKNISVRMQGRDIVRISYKGRDPYEVQKVADTITDIFISRHLEDQEKGAVIAIGFIESQLKVYKEKLEVSEASLREYKEEHLLEMPGQVNVNLDRLVGFETSLIELGLELKEARKKRDLLKKQLSSEKEVVVAERRQEQNPVIAQLNQHLVKVETKLATLLVDATEEHPTVKELRREIRVIKDRIKEQEQATVVSSETTKVSPTYQRIQDELNNVEVKVTSLDARKREVERLKEKYGQIAKNIPRQEQEMISLTRDRDVYKGVYNMLLKKLETARISQRLEFKEKASKFLILDSARLPLTPIKPDKTKASFMGLIVGIMVGVGCVSFAEYVDHSFRGIEDAKSYLDIPYLGAISSITTEEEASEKAKKKARKKKAKGKPEELPEMYIAKAKDNSGILPQILSYCAPTSVIAEQYRILRTKIQSMNIKDKPLKVIGITSVTHQEGKTVTAVNIAVTLAKALDKKILLIDCDMRRGTVHKYMGLKKLLGLGELLSNGLGVKEAIQNNKVENLDIISCGEKPENPSELLESSKMDAILKKVHSSYDYIILDAPPILPVTDAEIIARKVDGIIMVVRSAKTQRETVSHAESLLKQVDANILGFILTHVKYYIPGYLYRYLEYPSNYYY